MWKMRFHSTNCAGSCLLQIGTERLDEIVGGLCLFVGGTGVRVQDVEADVALDDLCHKRVHRTAAGGDVVEYIGALSLLIERSFNRIDLPADAPDTIQ